MSSFKPFEQMTDEDYANLGLRCGLEVHQQLLTRTKLFCRCPAGKYSEKFETEILRHMRPTLSELGEYDGTALIEIKTKKNVFYRIHPDTVCTYEFDDTPPFFIAQDALDTAMELSLLLRLNMVSEIHIARKQYLDGSIPAGFQRTTILGVNGWIPFEGRKIGIRQLGLEEDSCREVSDIGHDRVYLTDRLGMPLIEVVTEPQMFTPDQTMQVGQIIRRLCRSTRKVRTGYGATRQDLNVSIRGGTRIEIKGVPQIWRFSRLIYNEARRQFSLLEIREDLKKRGVTSDSFQYKSSDVTRLLAKSRYQPIESALSQGLRVQCIVLKGFAGLLNKPTQEHTTFAKEFSDRVRVVACLTHLPNIAHSDSASETLFGRDWQKIHKKLKTEDRDALILCWGNAADTQMAVSEIALRAKEATLGVPSSTQQGLKDGTTGFERVLPGAERMYPDTDLPPIVLSPKKLQQIQKNLPEYVWDREDRFRQMGIPKDTIEVLSISPRIELFSRLLTELKINPTFAAVVLCQTLKSFRRKRLKPERLRDETIFHVFQAYAKGKLAREGVVTVLELILVQNVEKLETYADLLNFLEVLKMAPLSESELTQSVLKAVENINPALFRNPQKIHSYLMGKLMRNLIGRVDGKKLSERVQEQLQVHDSKPLALKAQA